MNKRSAMTQQQRQRASRIICEQLLQHQEIQQAKVIFSYCATPEEVNLDELNKILAEQGKTVLYPISHKGGIMDAAADTGEWTVDRFGIRTPLSNQIYSPENIDVIIMPCVAFDDKKHRLGHGGGYYDRYCEKCPNARRILVAFEIQKLEEIAVEETDILPNLIVTEERSYE